MSAFGEQVGVAVRLREEHPLLDVPRRAPEVRVELEVRVGQRPCHPEEGALGTLDA